MSAFQSCVRHALAAPLTCVLVTILASARAAEPTVGGGWYDMSVLSLYLMPDDYRNGLMTSTQSLSLDHSYEQTHLDDLPPSSAQSFGSLILNCYDIPIAFLEFETTYSNIPISAGCSVGGSINYKFVAYNKIGLELPSDVRVPLIAKGYVHASVTNAGDWDFALAESTVTTSSYDTIDLVARAGSAGSGGDVFLPLDTGFYVHPDQANSVALSVAGNIVFSDGPLSGSKGFQAIADPNIYVDPTATITDIGGTTHNASDVFGVAFSPGFMVPVPEPTTIADLIGLAGVGLALVWRKKKGREKVSELFFRRMAVSGPKTVLTPFPFSHLFSSDTFSHLVAVTFFPHLFFLFFPWTRTLA